MEIKFPNTWVSTYQNDPFDENGNLTPLAAEWSTQLADLTPEEIKAGIDALATREEKRFPPNAMEFKYLCRASDNESVLDAILDRLQDGDGYEWTNQLAFNCWCKWGFDYKAANNFALPKMIAQHVKMIDKDSLFNLPDYKKRALEQTEPAKTEKEKEIIKRRFFATMTAVLIQNEKIYPDDLEHKMKTGRGWEIVEDYLKRGYKIPPKAKQDKEMEKSSFESLFKKIKCEYRDSMRLYLTELGAV